MIRIGQIGLGRWGKRLIGGFAAESDIKTVCTSGNVQNLEWLRSNFPSVHHTVDSRDIFNDDSIDAVVIASPIDTHCAYVLRGLEAGKHVFVEKPPAISNEQFKKIADAAGRSGKRVFTGYIYLYHDMFRLMSELIEDKTIKSVHSVWEKEGTFAEDLTWNLLIHEAAIARKLFGMPVRYSVLHSCGTISATDMLMAGLDYGEFHPVSLTVPYRLRLTSPRRAVLSIRGAHPTPAKQYQIPPANPTRLGHPVQH